MKIDQTELIWLDEHHEVSMDELLALTGLTSEALQHLLEIGALVANNQNEVDMATSELRFSSDSVVSIRTLSRLKADFELEQNSLGLMLVFLERIRKLELQLRGVENTQL